jgi:dihydrofolate reductase
MRPARIAVIAARDRNGVIGRDNAMPWRLRDDLQLFKKRTLGHPVIMGRKTWESLGRPLPGRLNIVISRQATLHAPGALVVDSFESAVQACAGADTVFIIGGQQIYAQALPHADLLYLTEVDTSVENGDTYFPAVDLGAFECLERRHFQAGAGNDFAFDVVTYQHRRA